MAIIVERANIDLQCNFLINEAEARALDAMAGYGDDAFVKAFYEGLGEAYMRRHEKGLRHFLKSVREFIPPILTKLDRARKAFTDRPQ